VNSQQLILERIADKIADDESIILITDRGYSNTGMLRTLDSDSLQQIASVSYNFQSGYVNFGGMSNYVASLSYDSPSAGAASWVKRSIPELVDAVVAHLTKRT
jgi:hypothetical protein